MRILTARDDHFGIVSHARSLAAPRAQENNFPGDLQLTFSTVPHPKPTLLEMLVKPASILQVLQVILMHTKCKDMGLDNVEVTPAQPSELFLQEAFSDPTISQSYLFIFLAQNISPSQHISQVLQMKYLCSHLFHVSTIYYNFYKAKNHFCLLFFDSQCMEK
jgi:hypothetical protein